MRLWVEKNAEEVVVVVVNVARLLVLCLCWVCCCWNRSVEVMSTVSKVSSLADNYLCAPLSFCFSQIGNSRRVVQLISWTTSAGRFGDGRDCATAEPALE